MLSTQRVFVFQFFPSLKFLIKTFFVQAITTPAFLYVKKKYISTATFFCFVSLSVMKIREKNWHRFLFFINTVSNIFVLISITKKGRKSEAAVSI